MSLGYSIHDYHDIETIKDTWSHVSIFGAGRLGRVECLDFLNSFGFIVDSYYDNNAKLGLSVNGIIVKDKDFLYANKDKIFVFICVSLKYRFEINRQFLENSITNYAHLGICEISNVLESIESSDDSVKKKYTSIYSDEQYLKRIFKSTVGYDLNLANPNSFNEKIQWLKIHDHNPIYTDLVDKVRFKEFISKRYGKEYVIPMLGEWNCYEEIEFDKLPDRFVLKCNHDSGSAEVISDKNRIDHKQKKNKYDLCVSSNYYWIGREWPYKNIDKKIIAERFVSDNLIDYKFLCFDGEPLLVFTCTDRYSKDGLKVTFFDSDWNRQVFSRHYPVSIKPIEKPSLFSNMLELSKDVSKGMPFVRVDFYESNNQLYFGELTFYPGSGFEEFSPYEWDYVIGEWINLPKK